MTNTAARSRPSKLVHSRFLKAKHMISKISQLAQISRQARKLFSGSGYAASTWGHQASGLSDSHILNLERSALSCTGIKAPGRCRTFALIISYGLLGTPRARFIR